MKNQQTTSTASIKSVQMVQQQDSSAEEQARIIKQEMESKLKEKEAILND